MSKKDYQAIAAAIYQTRRISAERPWDGERIIQAIADVMAAGNSRFDRARFLEACETGRCKGMRSVAEPLCVQAMRCYCAGHARGNDASEPCDTREAQ